MKKYALLFMALTTLMTACDAEDPTFIEGNFAFVEDYEAVILVGGIVGVEDRTFKEGEIFEGRDEGNDFITIQIAEHSERNEDCPNPWCYQEKLEVPRALLQYID